MMEDNDFRKILSEVKIDREGRAVFLAIPREEQLLAILGIIAYISNRLSNLEKGHINFEKELRDYRKEREDKESKYDSEIMNITQKIANEIRKAFESKFDYGVYFRDKILPPILVLIITGILYFVFGGKLP